MSWLNTQVRELCEAPTQTCNVSKISKQSDKELFSFCSLVYTFLAIWRKYKLMVGRVGYQSPASASM